MTGLTEYRLIHVAPKEKPTTWVLPRKRSFSPFVVLEDADIDAAVDASVLDEFRSCKSSERKPRPDLCRAVSAIEVQL